MLQEFLIEITQILNQKELLENENSDLKDSVESLSKANAILQEEKTLLENKILELEKNENDEILLLNAEINTLRTEKEILKEQSNIKLEDVKTIITELKELIANV